jgi:hypothetical protein
VLSFDGFGDNFWIVHNDAKFFFFYVPIDSFEYLKTRQTAHIMPLCTAKQKRFFDVLSFDGFGNNFLLINNNAKKFMWANGAATRNIKL